jgi:hypothetical protein
MKVNQINNQNSISFGVLKIDRAVARKIAQEIHSKPNPQAAEKYFIENIAEPIHKLKSIVTATEKAPITVKGPKENQGPIYPICEKYGKFPINLGYDNNVRIFTTYPNGGYNASYKYLEFPTREEAMNFYNECMHSSELFGRLLCARELGKEYDKSALARLKDSCSYEAKNCSLDATVEKLEKLYG